jgi:hypothetical protein
MRRLAAFSVVSVLLAAGCGSGTSKTATQTKTVSAASHPTTPRAYVDLMRQLHAEEKIPIRGAHNPAIEAQINQTNIAAPTIGLSAVYLVDLRFFIAHHIGATTSSLSRCEIRTFNTLTGGQDAVTLDRLIVDLTKRYKPAVALVGVIAAHCRVGAPLDLG